MSDNGDYKAFNCCTCGVLHWIPKGLWETCEQTKNDARPLRAYCPYGHPYVGMPDAKSEEKKQPEPPKFKKPKRFWQKKEKQAEGNVIDLKTRNKS